MHEHYPYRQAGYDIMIQKILHVISWKPADDRDVVAQSPAERRPFASPHLRDPTASEYFSAMCLPIWVCARGNALSKRSFRRINLTGSEKHYRTKHP
jgi:hypothetical protein